VAVGPSSCGGPALLGCWLPKGRELVEQLLPSTASFALASATYVRTLIAEKSTDSNFSVPELTLSICACFVLVLPSGAVPDEIVGQNLS
jgi:hypothetical protein